MKNGRVRQIGVGRVRLGFDLGDSLFDLLRLQFSVRCISFLGKRNSHGEVGSAGQSWGIDGLPATQGDFARCGISRTSA